MEDNRLKILENRLEKIDGVLAHLYEHLEYMLEKIVNNKNIYTKNGSIYLSTSGSRCQFN